MKKPLKVGTIIWHKKYNKRRSFKHISRLYIENGVLMASFCFNHSTVSYQGDKPVSEIIANYDWEGK